MFGDLRNWQVLVERLGDIALRYAILNLGLASVTILGIWSSFYNQAVICGSFPINHESNREKKEYEEPEPDSNVDLVVYHVDWEDAEPVKLLDCSGSTKVVERALGDLREDSDHGIVAFLIVEHCKGKHLETIGGELSSQQPVYQVDLNAAVGKVHYLADHKPGFIGLLSVLQFKNPYLRPYKTCRLLLQ